MKAAPFDYVRATALNDVFDTFERHGDEAQIVAGGQSLMPILNMRLAAPRVLVDINHVAELSGVSVTDGTLRIGACVTHRDLESDPLIAVHAPALANVWGEIGNVRIRIAGTLGGNILSGDPGYDGLPALIALNAVAVFEDSDGPRAVPAAQLAGQTAGEENAGLLTAIEVPVAPSRRFLMDRSLKPVVSVALSADVRGGAVANRNGIVAPAGGTVKTVGEAGKHPFELQIRHGYVSTERWHYVSQPVAVVFVCLASQQASATIETREVRRQCQDFLAIAQAAEHRMQPLAHGVVGKFGRRGTFGEKQCHRQTLK